MAQVSMTELNREIRKSEILRTEILMGLFAIFIVLFNVLFIFGRQTETEILPVRMMVTGILVTAFLFEWQVRRVVTRHLDAERPPPTAIRYAGATLELTLVSLSTFLLARHASVEAPWVPLLMPPPFIFFIFIVLSTLRLDLRLSIFTGVVAGAQYLGLFFLLRPDEPLPGPLMPLMNPPHHLAKAFILMFAGLSAGLVARRIHLGTANVLRVRGLFGQHVSTKVVDMLLEQKSELASETRHVCVMFVDIRDFTSFSERHPPEKVVEYLNTLFASLIESVNVHGGIVNKFLGDGFMAVFGAPMSDGHDCRNGLRAAREILAEVARLNASGAIPPTRIGIGLHAGRVVTGNVGSATRKEYTIVGDTVNVASRIESLNKQYGSQLLASEDVLRAAGEVGADPKGPVQVKGRTAAIEIFQLA